MLSMKDVLDDEVHNNKICEASAQKYLNKIAELSNIPASLVTIQDIAEYVIKCIAEICETEQIYILQSMHEGHALRVCASRSRAHRGNKESDLPLDLDDSLVRKILTDAVSVFVRDNDQFEKIVHNLIDTNAKKYGVIAPISGDDEPWGALVVLYKSSKDMTKIKIAFLQAVANVIAISVKYFEIDEAQEAKSHNLSIVKAKQDWEISIDSLSQLIVVLDEDANVIRANRTIEAWGLGSVNSINGQHIAELLKPLGNDNVGDLYKLWKTLFAKLKLEKIITWERDKKYGGRILLFTLCESGRFEVSSEFDQQSQIILTVEDITEYRAAETVLRKYNSELEKLVSERTRELKIANRRLKSELRIQKQHKLALIESKGMLHSLSRQFLQSQEQDRKRISNDLHDEIGQSIGAVKFKIEELLHNDFDGMSSHTTSQLNKLVGMLKHSIGEVQRISMQLRPSTLDDLGIVMTIDWFCREFKQVYTGLVVNKEIDINEIEIPGPIKIVIYRIIQEALNNIVKHANATVVNLALKRVGNQIVLSITDNGCGFDTKKVSQEERLVGGIGLKSMSERARSSGAELKIESNQIGTKILVKWD